jgi:hypothetical protein
MANRFARFLAEGTEIARPGNEVVTSVPQIANRFSKYVDSAGRDLGVGGLSGDASPLDYARQSSQVMREEVDDQPRVPQSLGASLLQGEQANALAARQGTDPGVYEGDKPLRTVLGEATTDDADRVWFKDESGVDTLADTSKHVVLQDPKSGKYMVYARDPNMDETRLKSLGRLLLPFLVTGPVTGAYGPAKMPASLQRATRLNEGARDLEAFEALNVPTPGFAFGSGPMAAMGLEMQNMPIVGGMIQGQVERALEGGARATGEIASSIGEARTAVSAGERVQEAMRRGLEGTAQRIAGVADELSPTASPFDTGRALQEGVERARSANVADLEPGVVERLGIPAQAPVQRPLNMSQGAAAQAAEAAPIRESLGEDFLRRGQTVRSIPTETSRGVQVPSALPRDLTLTTRTTAEMLDDTQLGRLIRTPAAQTSFASRAEALYERAWRMLPAMMRQETASGRVTANPNMVAATNTREALGQIDQSIANQIAGQGTINGDLAARLRNPRAANFQMDDLRAIRTEVGRAIGKLNPLTATLDGGQLRQLYGAITRDMEIGFETIANRALIRSRLSNNRSDFVPEGVAREAAGALRAFRTADRYYRAGQVRFERFSKLLRAQNPEAASKIIINATKGRGQGDIDLVRTALAVLRPEERNEIASLVLREMGMPSSTARGMEQAVGFSGSNFQKAWRDMNPAARNMLFRPQHLSEIETALQEIGRWDRVRSILNAENPQAIFGSIKKMALSGEKGDIGKLRTVKSLMKPEEWDDVRSAFILAMGEPKPNVKGMVEKVGWSPTSMQTNLAAMDPEARLLFFTGSHQTAMEELFRVSSRLADVLALTNTSRTLSNSLGIAGLGWLAGKVASGDLMGLILGPTAYASAAYLLSRPQHARWAVRWARLKASTVGPPVDATIEAWRNKELLAQINRLAEMAKTDPELIPILQGVRSENGIEDGVVESPNGNHQQ